MFRLSISSLMNFIMISLCIRFDTASFYLWNLQLRTRNSLKQSLRSIRYYIHKIITSFLPLFLDLWVKTYFVSSCKKVLGCHLILHWGRRHFRSSSWLVFIAWCHNCVKWCKGCQSSWVIVLWYKVMYWGVLKTVQLRCTWDLQ